MTPHPNARAHAALSGDGDPVYAAGWVEYHATPAGYATSLACRQTALAASVRDPDSDPAVVRLVARGLARALLLAEGLHVCTRCDGGGCAACNGVGAVPGGDLTRRLIKLTTAAVAAGRGA